MSFFSMRSTPSRHSPRLTAPIDFLVGLLWQPMRRNDGVATDIDAARQRERR
jgi:hypothetical protein